MRRRPLGRSGLEVAPLAFGGNVFGWTVDDAMAGRLLDRFVDAGYNLIDTADVYSNWVPGHVGGESEAMVGRWLKRSGRRNDVLIATKVGMKTAQGTQGLAPDHIRRSLDASLERLATDHVDLYQSHVDDPGTPLADTLSTYRDLRDAGRVRAIGASNYSGARLTEAIGVSRQAGLPEYQSLQPRYNLLDRAEFERDQASACAATGVGLLPYAALASGFLTGKYRSADDIGKSPRGPRMTGRLDGRGLRILDALDQVAKELDSRPATVALAWLMARPGVTAPIASATSVQQLDELFGAADLTLDSDARRRLDEASRP